MANMKLSDRGIALIKSFEGCRLTAYKAVKTEKYYTIGWGHYGADVGANQTISQAEADALFLRDIEKFVKSTNTHITSFIPNQNQFDALVSFCYNCGAGNLKKLLSGRTPEQVAVAMMNYNKSRGKELAGLTRRRKAEQELFNSGLQTPASTNSSTISTVPQSKKPEAARSRDNSIAGKYKVTASALYMRLGASTMKSAITKIKRNEIVQCHGYYTAYNGVKWYLVQYKEFTGYCSSEYLQKI